MRQIRRLIFSITLMANASAHALEFGIGLAAQDDMGDQAIPTATLRFGWTATLHSTYGYWGRTIGPSQEREHFLTLCFNKTLPSWSRVEARYGVVFMTHQTSLYNDDTSQNIENGPEPIHENGYNAGLVLGIGVPANLGPVHLELSWDSHIYTIASPSFIYLASGRKQVVGLTMGVSL